MATGHQFGILTLNCFHCPLPSSPIASSSPGDSRDDAAAAPFLFNASSLTSPPPEQRRKAAARGRWRRALSYLPCANRDAARVVVVSRSAGRPDLGSDSVAWNEGGGGG